MNNLVLKVLIIAVGFSHFPTYAEPRLLIQGETSPYKGWLFPIDEEQNLRAHILYIEKLNESNLKILEITNKDNELLNKQVTVWRDQSQVLSERLVKVENNSFWKQAGFFVLGAVITTAIVYGTNKASK